MREFLHYHLSRLAARLTPPAVIPNLWGDRHVEWSFIVARMARLCTAGHRILDFGTGVGTLASAAAATGADVLSIDLHLPKLPVQYPNVTLRKTDILDVKDETFDLILNCSVIEHVGLGVRYDLQSDENKDLQTMRHLRTLLAPGGAMLLTLPVGIDGVFPPHHRVYGATRLPQLLEGFTVAEEEFWKKNAENIWHPCAKEEALRETPSNRYYALGCFVLTAGGA